MSEPKNNGFNLDPQNTEVLRDEIAKALCLLQIENNIRRDPKNISGSLPGMIQRAVQHSYPEYHDMADAALLVLSHSKLFLAMAELLSRILGSKGAQDHWNTFGAIKAIHLAHHSHAVLKMAVKSITSEDGQVAAVSATPQDSMVLAFLRERDGHQLEMDDLTSAEILKIRECLGAAIKAGNFFKNEYP